MNELEEALKLIESGWCQRALVQQDGKVCALGAIAMTELNVDEALIQAPSFESDTPADAWRAHQDYEVNIYSQLDNLHSVKVLAQTILEENPEWFEEGGYDQEEINHYLEHEPGTIVYNFNDGNDQYTVMEMFKLAAKKLDNK